MRYRTDYAPWIASRSSNCASGSDFKVPDNECFCPPLQKKVDPKDTNGTRKKENDREGRAETVIVLNIVSCPRS